MVDLKLGNTAYNGIDRIQISKSDSSGVVNFAPSDELFGAMGAASGYVSSYYENPYITTLSPAGAFLISNFETVYLPNLTSMVANANLGNINRLSCKNFIAPKLTMSPDQLTNGGNVEVVDFTDLTGMRYYAMGGSELTAVILRGNTVVDLSPNAANFKSGVTAYVPTAMLSAYNADTLWAGLVSSKNWTITAIEGSQYENPNWFKS